MNEEEMIGALKSLADTLEKTINIMDNLEKHRHIESKRNSYIIGAVVIVFLVLCFLS